LALIVNEISRTTEWNTLITKSGKGNISIDPILNGKGEKINEKPLRITRDNITEKFMICYLFIWQLLFDKKDNSLYLKELHNYLKNFPVDPETGFSIKFTVGGTEYGFSYNLLKKTTTLMRNNGLAHYGKYKELAPDNFDIYQIFGFDYLVKEWVKKNGLYP